MTKREFLARIALLSAAPVAVAVGVSVCKCAYDSTKIPRMVRHSDGTIGVHGAYEGVDISKTEAFDRRSVEVKT